MGLLSSCKPVPSTPWALISTQANIPLQKALADPFSLRECLLLLSQFGLVLNTSEALNFLQCRLRLYPGFSNPGERPSFPSRPLLLVTLSSVPCLEPTLNICFFNFKMHFLKYPLSTKAC